MVNFLLNRNLFFVLLSMFMFVFFFDTNVFAGGGGGGGAPNQDPTGIVIIFCNVIKQITGGVGKVISILILISMAIGLFLGKITWGLAIAVMVGMGLLFGASGIVDSIAKGASDAGSDKICDTVNQNQ